MFGTMAATGLWPQHTIPTSAVCFDQAGIETASTPGSLVMQRCETAVRRVPRNVGSKRQPANSVGQFLLLISYPSRAWRSDFKLRTSCKPAKPGHHHAELQHDCSRPQSSKRPDQMFTTIDDRHRPVSLVQVMLPSSSEIDGVDEMIIVEWHFLQPTRQHSPRQLREPAGQSFRFGLQPHEFCCSPEKAAHAEDSVLRGTTSCWRRVSSACFEGLSWSAVVIGRCNRSRPVNGTHSVLVNWTAVREE